MWTGMGFLSLWGYGILTNSFFTGESLLFITGHDLQEEK